MPVQEAARPEARTTAQLLAAVVAMLMDIAQAPKMAPHIAAMCRHIAEDLNVDVDCINVKATTTEKLGFEGRKEGIAVQAIALIEK